MSAYLPRKSHPVFIYQYIQKRSASSGKHPATRSHFKRLQNIPPHSPSPFLQWSSKSPAKCSHTSRLTWSRLNSIFRANISSRRHLRKCTNTTLSPSRRAPCLLSTFVRTQRVVLPSYYVSRSKIAIRETERHRLVNGCILSVYGTVDSGT